MANLSLNNAPASQNEAADQFVDSVSAAMPPNMQRNQQMSADEILKEMNRVPLFMTSLDETDGDGGDNTMLEAIKALAYEGTRAEVAENFRQQGNEAARAKLWKDAREFYTKGIQALRGQAKTTEAEDDHSIEVVELDEEAEAKKERSIEEACLSNRALCNLEMSITSPRQILHPPHQPPKLTKPPSRKLRLLQQRLRRRPSRQPPKPQSLVPRSIRLPRPRPAPGSPGCLRVRPAI